METIGTETGREKGPPPGEWSIRGLPIGLVIGSCRIGGAERQCALLARELQSLGADVRVFFLDWPFRHSKSERVDFSRVPTRHLGNRLFGYFGAIGLSLNRAYLARLLRASRIKVLHYFLLGPEFATLGPGAARAARINALVGGVRSLRFAEETQTCEWLRRATKVCTGLACNSREAAERLLALGVVGADRLFVINNGIEVPPVRAAGGDASRRVEVLFAGSLKPVKDPLCFVEGALRLLRAGKQCRFIMAGDGPFRPMIEKTINEAGASASFNLLGLVPPKSVPYERARVLVSSSLREGSSNSILEALAHGTPVVATAVGGAKEVLRDRPFGTLVEPRNPVALSAAIDHWVSMPQAEWDAASAAARKHIVDHFSVEKMVARHCAFYRWALDSGGRAAGKSAAAARTAGMSEMA